MNQRINKILFDIIDSINSINDYIKDNKDFNYYQNNKLIRRAVERELEIIGEAVNRILKIEPKIQISNARKIVDARNWVIHGYDKVDDVLVWGIIIKYLPKLKAEVDAIIKNFN